MKTGSLLHSYSARILNVIEWWVALCKPPVAVAFIGILGTGSALVRAGQFALADACFAVAGLVLLAKSMQLAVDSPASPRWLRAVCVLGVVTLTGLLLAWTQLERGAKSWIIIPGYSELSQLSLKPQAPLAPPTALLRVPSAAGSPASLQTTRKDLRPDTNLVAVLLTFDRGPCTVVEVTERNSSLPLLGQSPNTAKVLLSAGLHTLSLKSKDGNVHVQSVAVQPNERAPILRTTCDP